MKKEYKHDTEKQGHDKVGEPALEYGTSAEKGQETYLDIPEEYLLRRLKQAEKEIAEGKGIPFDEAMKRFIQ